MKIRKLGILTSCLMMAWQCSFGVQAASNTKQPITRAEFIELINPLNEGETLSGELKVRPTENMTREEAAYLLAKELGYEGIAKNYINSKSFSDITSYKGEIQVISELGILNGVGNNLFNPKGNVTVEQAQVIVNRVKSKVNAPTKWKNGFYALSSSSQMNDIPKFDAVSFGWAQLQYNEMTKNIEINTTSAYGNDFSIPKGFESPIDLATTNGVEKYLMIYLEDQSIGAAELGNKVMLSEKLFENEKQVDKLIYELVNLCKGIERDGVVRGFDGLTIDFENFSSEKVKASYNTFLSKLNAALDKENKKLNVAVHPNTYFKGYDYRHIGEVADKVILMAHDYAPKMLNSLEMESGIVMTPEAPITQIYEALKAITHPNTGVKNKEKIVLQVSFASTQWQEKDGKVLNSKPYKPSYDKIADRLNQVETVLKYDKPSQSPYAVYTQDGTKNVIWYENETSIQAKIALAKLFGVYNISFWRLGTIPEFKNTTSRDIELDILGNKKIFNQ